MAGLVAHGMADGQILQMAVATVGQWPDVLQGGRRGLHMIAADPARHLAMQLACDGLVNLVAGVAESAHTGLLGHGQSGQPFDYVL